MAADGVWRDIGTLRFNHNSGSDYVVSAVPDFTPGNTANGLVEYQITVDGVQHGWFTRRTPEVFPGTQAFRASVPDQSTGIHTIALRARNLSNAAVLYNRVWITPLLVDSAETTLKNAPGGSVTVTSSFARGRITGTGSSNRGEMHSFIMSTSPRASAGPFVSSREQ